MDEFRSAVKRKPWRRVISLCAGNEHASLAWARRVLISVAFGPNWSSRNESHNQ